MPNNRHRLDVPIPDMDPFSYRRRGPEARFPMAGPSRPPPDARRTTCRYHAAGYCWRGDSCWFLHEDRALPIASTSSSAPNSKHPLPARPTDGQGIQAILKDTATPDATANGGTPRKNARQLAMERDQAKARGETVDEDVDDGAVEGEVGVLGTEGVAAVVDSKGKDKSPSASVADEETSEADGRARSNSEQRPECCICFETPTMYGLLERCSHAFCLSCIREWRVTKGKVPEQVEAGVLRQCPACRVDSGFVLPNKHFLPNGVEKDRKVESLKHAWARIPCKNLEKYGDCPFGHECFYKHVDRNGHAVILHHSHADWLLARARGRRERQMREDDRRLTSIAPYVLANLFGLPRRSGAGGARAPPTVGRNNRAAATAPTTNAASAGTARRAGQSGGAYFDEYDEDDEFYEDDIDEDDDWIDEDDLEDYWEETYDRLWNLGVDPEPRGGRLPRNSGFAPASAALRNGAGAGAGIAMLAGMSGLEDLIGRNGPLARGAFDDGADDEEDDDDLPPLERADDMPPLENAGIDGVDPISPPVGTLFSPPETDAELSRSERRYRDAPDNWDDPPRASTGAAPQTSRAVPMSFYRRRATAEVDVGDYDDEDAWSDEAGYDDDDSIPELEEAPEPAAAVRVYDRSLLEVD